MDDGTLAILLFKPQFEVWNKSLTKHWLPKNAKIVEEKKKDFFLLLQRKWVKVPFSCDSTLTWERWNKETFILIQK
jgi:predicted rRNA methylase YqxC with S4 and FtsJ domains